MREVCDLSRNELETLCAEYQGFLYSFMNSFVSDLEFCKDLLYEQNEAVKEDYDVLLLCFASMCTTEDKILRSEWLIRDIQEEFGGHGY